MDCYFLTSYIVDKRFCDKCPVLHYPAKQKGRVFVDDPKVTVDKEGNITSDFHSRFNKIVTHPCMCKEVWKVTKMKKIGNYRRPVKVITKYQFDCDYCGGHFVGAESTVCYCGAYELCNGCYSYRIYKCDCGTLAGTKCCSSRHNCSLEDPVLVHTPVSGSLTKRALP